jgi:hypothetical protein
MAPALHELVGFWPENFDAPQRKLVAHFLYTPESPERAVRLLYTIRNDGKNTRAWLYAH